MKEDALAFVTTPSDAPRRWTVTYSGLEYPGEVIVATSWRPEWGQPLAGESFFRIVLLLGPQRVPRSAVKDRRLALCLPRETPTSAQARLERDLGAIREARAVYQAGRQPSGPLRRSLEEQQSALTKQLLEEVVSLYRRGRIVSFPGLRLSASEHFQGASPQEHLDSLAGALLQRAYPRPLIDSSGFPAPFTWREARRLFEALFGPEPGPEERLALEGFGPELGLHPARPGRAASLGIIEEAFQQADGVLPADRLLAELGHRHGVPQPLATLYILAFLQHNASRAELSLKAGATLWCRDGKPFPGDRLTGDLLSELAWDEKLADSFDTLRAPQPPTWRTVLPYAIALEPGLAEAQGQEEQERRFAQTTRSIREGVAASRQALDILSKGLAQAVPVQASQALAVLDAVCGSDEPFAFYAACRAAGAGPQDLRAARGRAEKLMRLSGSARDIVQAKGYQEAVATGPHHDDLATDRAMLLAQLDLAALVDNPALWESLHTLYDWFRQRYSVAYLAHHRKYRTQAQALWSRLEQARPRARALEQLNALPELGSPLASDLPVRLEKLFNTVKRCDMAEDNASLSTVPLCDSCGLLLTENVPASEAERLLGELESALREQLRRLGSHAARQVMAQAGTPLVDRFLKVVQSGDLDGLAAVLDAQVLEFLRLFLRQP